MANEEHIALFKQDVADWNTWRRQSPNIHPDLSRADLSEANLRKANLRKANLREAYLRGADLGDAAMLDILRESYPQAVLKPFVNHDIRRTLRTRLAGLRVPEHISERTIGHGPRGTMKTYDVHRYEQETRGALTLWAAALRAIVEPVPPNVIAITRTQAERA